MKLFKVPAGTMVSVMHETSTHGKVSTGPVKTDKVFETENIVSDPVGKLTSIPDTHKMYSPTVYVFQSKAGDLTGIPAGWLMAVDMENVEVI